MYFKINIVGKLLYGKIKQHGTSTGSPTIFTQLCYSLCDFTIRFLSEKGDCDPITLSCTVVDRGWCLN